jgi:hypothetical protein
MAAAALEVLFGGGVRIVVIAELADPDGIDAALITQAIKPIRFHNTTLWRNEPGLFLPVSFVTADGNQTARMRAPRAVDFWWRDGDFFGGAGGRRSGRDHLPAQSAPDFHRNIRPGGSITAS